VIDDTPIASARTRSPILNRNPQDSGLPTRAASLILPTMATKSRGSLYGTSVRIAAQRAAEARREADKLACAAWTKDQAHARVQGAGAALARARRCAQCGLPLS
jgi:hypothetical protein